MPNKFSNQLSNVMKVPYEKRDLNVLASCLTTYTEHAADIISTLVELHQGQPDARVLNTLFLILERASQYKGLNKEAYFAALNDKGVKWDKPGNFTSAPSVPDEAMIAGYAFRFKGVEQHVTWGRAGGAMLTSYTDARKTREQFFNDLQEGLEMPPVVVSPKNRA